MGIRRGSISTPIIADGLVCNFDAANRASYPVQRTLTIAESGSCYNTLDLTQSGSFISDPEFITQPTSASCWAFDGVDDYITSNYLYPGTGDFFISFWIKTTATTNPQYALSIGSTAVNSAPGKIGYAGHLGVSSLQTQAWNLAHDSFLTWTADFALNDGVWHNCAIAYNDSYSPGRSSYYIDGLLQTMVGWGGAAYATEVEYSLNSTTPFNIGSFKDGYGNFFTGDVACVHIYNRVLSTSDVLHNYNALKSRFE